MLFWHIYLLCTIYLTSILKILNISSILTCELLTSFIVLRRIYKSKIKVIDINSIPKVGITSFKLDGKLNIEKYTNLFVIILIYLLWAIAILISYNTVVYNWDSMTYHLPRVAHWTQNQSVFPYATHSSRQIGSTSLTSYVCTYIYILSGEKEIFLNWVQCFAYGIDAYMVYAIAKKCKVKTKYCLVSSLIFMVLPIAFAEASTTQNDLYATMWLLFFVYIILDFNNVNIKLSLDMQSVLKVIWLAMCLAIGYLSKPSVCFAMAVALLWTLYQVIRRKDSPKTVVGMLCIGIIVCFILVLPSWLQNFIVWNKISPDNVGKQQLIGTIDIRYMFINFLKNSSYNLGNSIIPQFKETLSNILYMVSEIVGVRLNDETISEGGTAYGFSSHPYGCDTAMNPLVMVLFICAIVVLFTTWKKQTSTGRQYTLFALFSYIIFCFFLRWEHFISRYMVSYFALMCPAIVIQLQLIEDYIKSIWKRRGIYAEYSYAMKSLFREIGNQMSGTGNHHLLSASLLAHVFV